MPTSEPDRQPDDLAAEPAASGMIARRTAGRMRRPRVQRSAPAIPERLARTVRAADLAEAASGSVRVFA